MDDLIQNFEDPPIEYRAKPFWAWNGKLEETELLRQIDVFQQMGFGGFFMHSRTGLQTAYLSPKWFSLTDACTKAASEKNMEPWIYDEDRWPSGSAGGLVTKEKQYRRKYLTLTLNETGERKPPLAEFGAVCHGLDLSPGYRQISPGADLQPGETSLTFRMHTMKPQSVYNGFADADRLSRETPQRFLDITHRQYQQQCGEFSHICGVFTDEPHRGMVFSEFSDGGEDKNWSLPWTDDLAQMFEARYQEQLIPRLPELFLQLSGEPVAKIKWQYMELLQELFVERYLLPIQQWAHDHGKKTTGHFLHEDSLIAQAIPTGSMMRCYEYLDEPGIDNLTEKNYAPWAVKQLESVARQLGKEKKLSELYGGTGWQMSFADYKYVGDWQTILGINIRCPHLSWYTMEGQAKRDYPGSFLHQATWWQEYEALENYFARLSCLVSQGTPVCDTLVLHPVESLWYQIHPGWANGLEPADPCIQGLEQQFETLFHWLMGSQVDFDYADEGLLEHYGIVADGTIRIGKMTYKRLIVSGCPCIRESTYRLICQFQNAGGEVVFLGQPPQYIGGERDDRCRSLGRHILLEKQPVADYLREIPKPVSVLDFGEDLYLQTRETKDGLIALLWNKNREKSLERVPIQIPAGMSAQLWDCTTGQRWQLEGSPVLDFAPGQERVLVLSQRKNVLPPPVDVPEKAPISPELTGYYLTEPNVLPLDMAELYLGETRLCLKSEILVLDASLRETLGMEVRSGESVQPWARKTVETEGVAIRLRYCVEMDEIPEAPVYLAMEPLPEQNVKINGKRVPLKEEAWQWVDACFRAYAIPGTAWKKGENILELTASYSEDCGLEALFLLGQFGVWMQEDAPHIGVLPKQLHPGDAVSQGLPFYSGKVGYSCEPLPAGEYLLPAPQIGGACAVAYAGEQRKVLLWPWQKTEITLKKGQALTLEVVLTRHNTFGPLHKFPIKQPYIAPDSFADVTDPRYSLYPAGLLKAITLYPMRKGEDMP